MLGSNMYLQMKDKFDVYGSVRTQSSITENIYNFEHNEENLIDIIYKIKPDILINCIAILKENNDKLNMLYSNCTLPIFLSNYCKEKDIYFIHFSSDAVFKSSFEYNKVDEIHSPESFYGLTKAISESIKNKSLIFRICPIGYERFSNKSLFNFIFNSQLDSSINGFKNCFFNGTTVNEIINKVIDLINKNEKIIGLYHITGPTISKYELLQIINKEYNLNKNIVPVDNPSICRLLEPSEYSTTKDWNTMINEMKSSK